MLQMFCSQIHIKSMKLIITYIRNNDNEMTKFKFLQKKAQAMKHTGLLTKQIISLLKDRRALSLFHTIWFNPF